MGILDDVKTDTNILEDVGESVSNPLTLDQQDYVNEVSRELQGDESAPITSEDEWKALNKSESYNILQEDEESFIRNNIAKLAYGDIGFEEISQAAKDLAVEDSIANSDSGIPSAAAISVARDRLAVSDANNPENLAVSQQELVIKRHYSDKQAVLEDSVRMAQLGADKAGTWSKVKYGFNQIAPIPFVAGGISARTYRDALDAIGLTPSYSPTENKRLFLGLVSMQYKDLGTSPLAFGYQLKWMRDTMIEKGVNASEVSDLFDTLLDFSPEAESFYSVADILAFAPVAKSLVAATKTARIAGAIETFKKIAGAGVEYINIIPGLDGTLVKVSDKAFDAVAKPVVNATNKVSKLIKNNDRASAAAEIEKLIGNPVDSYKNKKTSYEYGTDSALKPEVFNEPSMANEKVVVAKKYSEAIQERIDLVKTRTSMLDQFKKESWEKHARNVTDTLELNNIFGAGKGVGVNDLIKAYEKDSVMAEKKTGDLVAMIRLKGGFTSVPSAQYADAGLVKAIKKGQRMSGTFDGITTRFSVEKFGNKWYTNLYIDTQKGWGTLHFDYVNGSNKALTKWRPFLSSIATATSNPKDVQILNIARNIDAEVLRSTGEAAENAVKGLSKEEKRLLQSIADIEYRYQAWYDSDYLKERGVPDKVITAHDNYHALNDIDYYIRNSYVRADMVNRGAKRISFNGKDIEGVGRVVPLQNAQDLKDALLGTEAKPGRDVLIDAIEGVPVSSKTLNDDELVSYFERGYRLIEGSLSPEDGVAARTFYYLLNPDMTVINDLGEFVTKYLAGGRGFYDRGAGFLKQLKIEKNAKGRKCITGVNTFATDSDFVGLERVSSKIEEMRQAYIKGEIGKLNSLINDSELSKLPFNNAEEFEKWSNNIGIDLINPENTLEVTKNGELMSSYRNLYRSSSIDDLVGFDDMFNLQHRSHFQAISNEAKQARARRTGKELFNYDFEKAQPVDIELQMRYMVNDMVYSGVMNNFTDFYAERFYKTFKDVLAIPDRGVQPAPIELLTKKQPFKEGLKGAQLELVESAKAAIKNYAAIRGIPTEFDSVIANKATQIMNWIGGAAQDFFHISEPVAHKVRLNWNKLIEKDPLGYGRAFTSHWYLGLGNISQLYKQAASDVSVMILEPKASLQAAKWSLPFSSALRKSNGDVLKAMDKLATKFNDAPEAVKQNFKSLIDMGVFEHGVAGGFLETGETVKTKFNRASMYFFNIGEMHNRTMAYLTAIYAKGYNGVKMTTEQLAEVASYGQKLFLNMDATGLSRIQTSTVGKTLLQFMGYRMRWLETVLFDKELTRAQRVRLALGTSLLVGGEGMLGVSAYSGICNVFNGFSTSTEPAYEDRNELARFIARGLLNYFSEESGLNVDIGAPLSLEYAEMLDAISGISKMDLPVVTSLGNGITFLTHMGRVIADSTLGEATIEDFENSLEMMLRAGEIPSSARPILGYLLWKNGANYNSKGQLTERTNSTLRSVLHGLGFNSLEIKDRIKAISEYSDVSRREKKIIKEALPIISMYYRNPSPYLFNIVDTMIKNADLSPLQKAKLWDKLKKEVGDTLQVPLIQLQYNKQLREGGFTGNNILQLGTNF